jgi:hypothetical protein
MVLLVTMDAVNKKTTKTNPKQRKLSAWPSVHRRYARFATRWRLSVTELVAFAIETLESLASEDVAARLERREKSSQKAA